MRLDAQEFPLIWMREHETDQDHDHDDDLAVFAGLINRGEKFVILSDKIPTAGDFGDDDPADRKARARMFKEHRSQIVRLCCGMILVGKADDVPSLLRKPLQAMAGLLGIKVRFAQNEQVARELAYQCIAER